MLRLHTRARAPVLGVGARRLASSAAVLLNEGSNEDTFVPVWLLQRHSTRRQLLGSIASLQLAHRELADVAAVHDDDASLEHAALRVANAGDGLAQAVESAAHLHRVIHTGHVCRLHDDRQAAAFALAASELTELDGDDDTEADDASGRAAARAATAAAAAVADHLATSPGDATARVRRLVWAMQGLLGADDLGGQGSEASPLEGHSARWALQAKLAAVLLAASEDVPVVASEALEVLLEAEAAEAEATLKALRQEAGTSEDQLLVCVQQLSRARQLADAAGLSPMILPKLAGLACGTLLGHDALQDPFRREVEAAVLCFAAVRCGEDDVESTTAVAAAASRGLHGMHGLCAVAKAARLRPLQDAFGGLHDAATLRNDVLSALAAWSPTAVETAEEAVTLIEIASALSDFRPSGAAAKSLGDHVVPALLAAVPVTPIERVAFCVGLMVQLHRDGADAAGGDSEATAMPGVVGVEYAQWLRTADHVVASRIYEAAESPTTLPVAPRVVGDIAAALAFAGLADGSTWDAICQTLFRSHGDAAEDYRKQQEKTTAETVDALDFLPDVGDDHFGGSAASAACSGPQALDELRPEYCASMTRRDAAALVFAMDKVDFPGLPQVRGALENAGFGPTTGTPPKSAQRGRRRRLRQF
jgi:hypothetical protein